MKKFLIMLIGFGLVFANTSFAYASPPFVPLVPFTPAPPAAAPAPPTLPPCVPKANKPCPKPAPAPLLPPHSAPTLVPMAMNPFKSSTAPLPFNINLMKPIAWETLNPKDWHDQYPLISLSFESSPNLVCDIATADGGITCTTILGQNFPGMPPGITSVFISGFSSDSPNVNAFSNQIAPQDPSVIANIVAKKWMIPNNTKLVTPGGYFTVATNDKGAVIIYANAIYGLQSPYRGIVISPAGSYLITAR